jgi:hypothetical protein
MSHEAGWLQILKYVIRWRVWPAIFLPLRSHRPRLQTSGLAGELGGLALVFLFTAKLVHKPGTQLI